MKTLGIAAVALVAATPVLAGGLAFPEAVVEAVKAPAGDFSGAYVGGSLGYGDLESDGASEAIFGAAEGLLDLDTDDDGDDDFVFDDEGLHYGAHVGYNVQRGNIVFGPELAVFGSKVEIGGESNFGDGFGEDAVSAEIDRGARLALRGGFAAGRTLVYGTLGAAYADISASSSGPFFGDGVNGDFSDWGYAAGVGVETLVTDNLSVGVQYTLHKFDDFDFDDVLIDGTEIDFEYRTLELRLSLGF